MPDPAPDRSARVAILGGGITGLAAALRLQEAGVDWRLFEATPRLGGVLETVEHNGYLVERSADNFLTRDPWATDLCERVGLTEQLLPTDPTRRRALVVSRGKIERVPEGFVLIAPQRAWPVLASPILSLAGKARLACEAFVPTSRDGADESVAAFARRRLGREAFQRLVQPLVAGIYTADPERLSMAATMPQFVRQEREHGSLTRAALRRTTPTDRTESGARYGLFVAPQGGMQQLVEAVVAKLPQDRLRTGCAVEAIARLPTGFWRLTTGADDAALGDFDELIVTLPAPAAGRLLRPLDEKLGETLTEIEYAGCSVVCLGVEAAQIGRPVAGFGFVVPTVERRRLIAASFSSYKFPGRAPEGRTLIRVFIGGALQPELAELDDDQLTQIACEELASLVGLRGAPEFAFTARWPQRMPQYHVGHLDRVATIDAAAERLGVELAGAAYRGVGVPQCVHSGEQAAERILTRLAVASPQS
ncbi:Protoporphyrinogen oxidase [Botrimarina colliarenosi]|uniref:Coproporphyrinogen III oxidase n=1 Tax=Botrimarina colliarenosi TaxID=2528001 RepID=A0A5C6A9H1_9BACT|nr:protoporphyrinogen oxidase [Botrimarina colliarenosi]TWT95997.1 Protoporphyrinogen oxidase [Botrimarina colliarenosi]